MIPALLVVFSWKVVNEKSDIVEGLEVCKAAEQVLKTVIKSASGRRKMEWNSPKNLSFVQVFPPHIVQYISQRHTEMTLFANTRQIPCTVWSEHRLF